MPTCCAPGCSNVCDKSSTFSFFRLPWNSTVKIRAWLSSLNLMHDPAQSARICHIHFEEKFLIVDPKYSVAPHLYPRISYRLTKDAVPTLFNHKQPPPVREASVSRKRKREQVGKRSWGKKRDRKQLALMIAEIRRARSKIA